MGFEVGVGDLGFRVVRPISDRQGKHLGTVEFGGGMDNAFIKSFTKDLPERVLEGGVELSVATVKLEEVFALVGEADSLQSEIYHAMQQQDGGSKQILEGLSAINDIMPRIRVGSGEMSSGNGLIVGEMEKLRAPSGEIGASISEVAARAG